MGGTVTGEGIVLAQRLEQLAGPGGKIEYFSRLLIVGRPTVLSVVDIKFDVKYNNFS
jgi:hypothetical protein